VAEEKVDKIVSGVTVHTFKPNRRKVEKTPQAF